MVNQSNSGIWVSKPLLRLLIPFILGILIAHFLQFENQLEFYVFSFTISLVSAYIIDLKARTLIGRISSGYLFLISLVSLGAFLLCFSSLNQRENFYGNFLYPNENHIYQVLIDEEPDQVKLGQRAFAKVQQIYDIKKNESVKTVGRILIYFRQDTSQSFTLNYGDQLIIHSKISEINKPKNPGDFNYGQYLALNNVFKSVYLDSSNILHQLPNKGNWLKKHALVLKQTFIASLIQFSFFDGVAGIIAALVTGDSGVTDPDLKSKFAATGTLHVLAVSGLHVGIIFMLLTWITAWTLRWKNGKVFQLVIILVILWLYAFFTGFSPSVTRAATMFSLISVGQQFSRKIYSINILAATAIIMLAYNPLQLFQLGMQLSFSALAGILVLTPYLTKYLTFKNNWLNKGYQLMCASLAAQLFTLPFSLFYFHQFSTYFLVANLVAIPLISIIASLSFISFFLGIIPIFQKIIWFVLDYFVFTLNFFIEFFASLPYSVFTFIPFDSFQFMIMIVGILVLIYIIEMKAYRLIYAFSLCVVLILVWLPVKELFKNDNNVIIFHHHSQLLLKVKKGIYADYFSYHDDDINFNQLSSQFQKSIEQSRFYSINPKNNALFVPDIGTFCWIDSISNKNTIPKSDFLIIHHPQISPYDFESLPQYKQVIFTSKKYNIHKYSWLKHVKNKNQPYYEIKKDGFFSLSSKKI